MSRTSRQEGLVRQRELEELRVCLIGANDEPLISSALGIVADQLGVQSFPIECPIPDFVIVLGKSSLPSHLKQVPHIWIGLTKTGIRMINSPVLDSSPPIPMMASGLSTIVACLAWQEILRRCELMVPVDVPKRYVTLSMRISTKELDQNRAIEEQLRIKGETGDTPYRVIPREDGTGDVVLRCTLDDSDPRVAELIDAQYLTHLSTPVCKPVEIAFDLPAIDGELSGNVLFVGLGGLGSWAIHTLAHGVEQAGVALDSVSITMVDPDLEIDLHNLNRQILYTQEDIGRTKADAAHSWLSRIHPNMSICSTVERIEMSHILDLISTPSETNQENLDEDDYMDLDVDERIISPELLNKVDIMFSGVDNLRTRGVLSALSARLGVPLINAGAQGYNGQLDIFVPDEDCMMCRYGRQIAKNSTVMSCQEDGEVPFSSIVTSTAIFGTLQGLALLAHLIQGEDAKKNLKKWPTRFAWSGRSNSVMIDHRDGPGMFNAICFSGDDQHDSHQLAELMGSSISSGREIHSIDHTNSMADNVTNDTEVTA